MPQSRTFKAAILGLGKFLRTISGIVTFVFLSRILTKSDYASYRQTMLVYSISFPLLALGLPKALYYFLPRDRDRGRNILTGNLILLSLAGCLFAVVLLLGGNRLLAVRFSNPELTRLLLIYSPYALLVLPVMTINACLVSNDRVNMLTVYNVTSRMTVLVCVIALTLTWQTATSAIVGTVLGSFLVLLPALFLMYRTTPGKSWHPIGANIRAQLKYGVPLGIAGMFGLLSMNLDKVLVSSMRSPEEFAVYANGAIEIPLITIVTTSVIAILIPEFVGLYKKKEYFEIISLWQRALMKCALIIFPVMIFLMISAEEIIRALFSARYIESTYPFRVYLLALPVRITSFGAIIMAAGRSKLILICSAIGLGINLFLSIVFINLLGSTGAAIATVLVLYVWSVPYYLVSIAKIFKISKKKVIPVGALTRVMLISLSGGVVFLLRPLIKPFGDIPVVLFSGLFYAGAIILLFDRYRLVSAKGVLRAFKRRKK